jgi:hypothetical protein
VGQSGRHGRLIVVTAADACDPGVASLRGSGRLTARPDLKLEFEFQN